jgi:hypothetical protein
MLKITVDFQKNPALIFIVTISGSLLTPLLGSDFALLLQILEFT